MGRTAVLRPSDTGAQELRCVRKAELGDRVARGIKIGQLLAPRIDLEAGEDGVVTVPLNHELLEVAGPLAPHLTRGVRPNSLGQLREVHSLRLVQLAGGIGGEEPGK